MGMNISIVVLLMTIFFIEGNFAHTIPSEVRHGRTSIGHWPLGIGHWQLPGTGNYWQLVNFPHVVTAPMGGSTLPNPAGPQTPVSGSSPTIPSAVKPPMEGSVPSPPTQAGGESISWGGNPTTSSSVSLDETSWMQHNQGSLLKNQSTTMVQEGFKILESEYGKGGVKILHVSKRGAVHTIQELEVESLLTLATSQDYERGDNSDIIATDTQKNTIYVLAKQHGIASPEEFGLLLVTHFISKYPWVVKAKVSITAHPWERIIDTQGRAHNHAFVSTPVAVRVAKVEYARGGRPIVSAGIRELRVLKTTQSAFTNFVSDEFRTLPDMDDRTFSTVVTADWTYGSLDSTLDFDAAHAKVLATVLEIFAGPADKGIFSPSVQHSQYLTQKLVLLRIPQVEQISISMPNVHYFAVDFSKFTRIPGLKDSTAGEVFGPVDKPSGQIKSTLGRAELKSSL